MEYTGTLNRRITRWERNIRLKYSSLKNGERMVADTVLRVREGLLQYSIGALALESGVSQPTVVRFCRSVGYQGIKDLKLAIAEEKASVCSPEETHSFQPAVGSIQSLGAYITNGCVEALKDTLDVLDFSLVEQAVDVLASAQNLDIVGVGGSSPVAILAQHNFRKAGLRVCTFDSIRQNYLLMERFQDGDVLLAVSQSGETPEVVEAAQVASDKGAFVIAVTDMHESSLGRIADVSLCSFCRNEASMGDNTFSRMAQLCIIDILYAGLCKKWAESPL
ncbi:MAG: MurR/RpiR family transcriptional regulator [Oscillibacter sp.]|nr:MurR/RpiR family transcriptional regulator [Oscillibacter sp.]